MQGAHAKALSCSVIATAKKRSDVKLRQLNARIKAAGDSKVGVPLHLKIKAYYMLLQGCGWWQGFSSVSHGGSCLYLDAALTAIDPQGPY